MNRGRRVVLGFTALSASMSVILPAAVAQVAQAKLKVVGVEPAPRSVGASVETRIRVHFDQPVDRDTIVARRTFWAFGRWSGAVDGRFHFSNGDRTVSLIPDRPLSAGEQVMVIVSHDVASAEGDTLRSGGYSWQFWTHARRADMSWAEVDRLIVRTNQGQRTQAYGGFGTDLDRDGFLDISIVNEITADVRVFMNGDDRSGTFGEFLRPTNPVRQRASPSEPTDFNADGFADACVVNIDDNTVSVLIGRGDGTFEPQRLITVGSIPRGVAVVDADGDGDTDIINTNSGGAGNLTLLRNDGNGNFAAAIPIEGGGTGEFALAAADMNNDGLLDVVSGSQSSQQITVVLADGNGGFVAQTPQSADGAVWQIMITDVDGDGNEDVAVVNGRSNRAAILMGDGNGQLAPPRRYPADPFALATDVGDIDGDDDMDWITSSYSGDWYVYINDGQGNFTFNRSIPSPQAASCALPMDIDNDGDLDLALIDEVADVVLIMKNGGTANVLGDGDGDCRINLTDLDGMADCFSGPGDCADPGCATFDFDDDCDVDLRDVDYFQRRYTGEESVPHCEP